MAMAAVLGITTIGISQCRFVDDTVTGVTLRPTTGLAAKTQCKKQCKERKKQAKRAEKARHKAAKKACKNLNTSAERKKCKKAESRKHKENKKQIKLDEKKCKDGCYNEGFAQGGR